VTPEHAAIMKTMAANQGLYNGFLAAGLGYSLLASNPDVAFTLKIFFLLCVVVAGIYGGVTVKPRIAIVQAVPATIALVVTLLAGRL
jgi:putative membrane protein